MLVLFLFLLLDTNKVQNCSQIWFSTKNLAPRYLKSRTLGSQGSMTWSTKMKNSGHLEVQFSNVDPCVESIYWIFNHLAQTGTKYTHAQPESQSMKRIDNMEEIFLSYPKLFQLDIFAHATPREQKNKTKVK